MISIVYYNNVAILMNDQPTSKPHFEHCNTRAIMWFMESYKRHSKKIQNHNYTMNSHDQLTVL